MARARGVGRGPGSKRLNASGRSFKKKFFFLLQNSNFSVNSTLFQRWIFGVPTMFNNMITLQEIICLSYNSRKRKLESAFSHSAQRDEAARRATYGNAFVGIMTKINTNLLHVLYAMEQIFGSYVFAPCILVSIPQRMTRSNWPRSNHLPTNIERNLT
jgi:hypothetical protein